MIPIFMLGPRLRRLQDELAVADLSDLERYDRFSAFTQDLVAQRLIAEREGAIATLSAALALGNPAVTRRAMGDAMAVGLSSADVGRINKIVIAAKAPPSDQASSSARAVKCC